MRREHREGDSPLPVAGDSGGNAAVDVLGPSGVHPRFDNSRLHCPSAWYRIACDASCDASAMKSMFLLGTVDRCNARDKRAGCHHRHPIECQSFRGALCCNVVSVHVLGAAAVRETHFEQYSAASDTDRTAIALW